MARASARVVPLSCFRGEGRGEEAVISASRIGSMNSPSNEVGAWLNRRYVVEGLLSPALSSKGGEGEARFVRLCQSNSMAVLLCPLPTPSSWGEGIDHLRSCGVEMRPGSRNYPGASEQRVPSLRSFNSFSSLHGEPLRTLERFRETTP